MLYALGGQWQGKRRLPLSFLMRRAVTHTDPAGRVTRYAYDAKGSVFGRRAGIAFAAKIDGKRLPACRSSARRASRRVTSSDFHGNALHLSLLRRRLRPA
ncbi:MAG: RHS repeat protein [Rhodocyclales bacterium]|nr:RHS repeat protein [Rhodocyclales bacterium]